MDAADTGVLDRILTGDLREAAVRDVQVYFTGYTGRFFERLDGGGDRPEVADRVTPADIVAVSSLSISWRREAPFELLGSRSREITHLLAAIPTVSITDTHAGVLLADSGPVDRLWALLRDIDDIGPTTAGKLLSRKRPALVPVFDQVVNGLIGRPERYWLWWHQQMSDPARVAAAERLRHEVGGVEDVSLLRILDVAIWMIGAGR
jgi:hypothetical protein